MGKPKLVPFNLNDAVRFILDETKASSIRAVRLYEFQIAVIGNVRPDRERRHTPLLDDLILYIKPALAAYLRGHASSAILEYLETQREDLFSGVDRLTSMTSDPEYAALYDQFIFDHGWRRMRSSPSARTLQKDIDWNRYDAQQTSKVVAFSTRFKSLKERPKMVGGVTSAWDVLGVLFENAEDDASKDFRPSRSISSLKKYWVNHKAASGLIYLAYFEREKCLVPPKLTDPHFAERLLKLVRNRENLLTCFGRYNALCDHLKRYRGYDLKKLSHDIPKVKLEPFPELPDSMKELYK